MIKATVQSINSRRVVLSVGVGELKDRGLEVDQEVWLVTPSSMEEFLQLCERKREARMDLAEALEALTKKSDVAFPGSDGGGSFGA